ncbi:unnamed protein product [Arctia plantaginis]|uniref:Uncharacterized protein n=1 Tax=Arctia plantaginis TaxID=874455 RepID=A0A8S0Z3P9_ARCPL|nr:unnamed protein product [Arctia plantaginis]
MNLIAEQQARIFDQCILLMLTYGAKIWTAVERKLEGITLRDHKTNECLRPQSKVTDVTKRVVRVKLECTQDRFLEQAVTRVVTIWSKTSTKKTTNRMMTSRGQQEESGSKSHKIAMSGGR